MKKAILFLAVLFLQQMVRAQTDVIYSTPIKVLVNNCQINQIKKGHWVVYTKDGATDSVQASAITSEQVYLDPNVLSAMELNTIGKNDTWLGIYRDHSYPYYSKIATHMKHLKIGSAVLSSLGMIGFAIGMEMVTDAKSRNDDKGRYLMLGGIVSFNVGFPLYLMSDAKYRRNIAAMERIKHVVSLSFGTTYDGIGLKLSVD